MNKVFKLVLVLISIVALVSCKQKLTVDDMVGSYIRSYEEEIEGKMIFMTNYITLNDDMTCMVGFQDDIQGTWDLNGNIIVSGETDKYKIKGDKLIYKRSDDGATFDFVKEK